jgi:hypothetical protein
MTYGRVAFENVPAMRMPGPRLLIGLGFTVWALRFWITLANNNDVMVAPVSMAAIGMITSGYCIVQLRAIRRSIALSRHPLHCFRDPEMPCQREDRVQEVLQK